MTGRGLALGVSVFLASGSPHAFADSSDGLVVYYPLHGNAQDATGNGHHGSLNGVLPTTNRFGQAGEACHFNGTTAVINVPGSPDLELTTNLTISAWVQRASFGSYLPIVCKSTDASTCSFMFGFDRDSNGLCLFYWTGKWNQGVSAPAVTDTQWHHVAVAYDGQSINFYVDGQSAGTVAESVAMWAQHEPLQIGFASPLSSADFSGNMNELRIYNRALSAVEVQQVYGAGASGVLSGLTNSPDSASGIFQSQGSEGFDDLVKLVQSGVDDQVVAAYIDASPAAYHLTPAEILNLNDLGVPAELIGAIEDHGRKLAGDVTAANASAAAVAQTLEPTPDYEPEPDLGSPQAQEVVQPVEVSAAEVAAPPLAATDVSCFYDALSPYGRWLSINGTWYWQPCATVLDRGWIPYCQGGNWVWTDQGWMWQSSYSWGWAPFHYGRWWHHGEYGWIWMPQTDWAPAWVSWRHSDTMVGWAPLPPEAVYKPGVGFFFHGNRAAVDFEFGLVPSRFTFNELAHFGEPFRSGHRWPWAELTRVYNTTTPIQNNYTFVDNRIVNRGPSVAVIQDATHREIKPVKIVDQSQRGRAGAISSGSMAVYRPRLAPTTRETPQAVVARRQADADKHVEAQRNSPFVNLTRPGNSVQAEAERGSSSRAVTPRTTQQPGAVSAPDPTAQAMQRQAAQAAAEVRIKSEEAASRQQAAALTKAQQETEARQAEQRHQAQVAEAARLQAQQEQTARVRAQAEAQAQQQREAEAARLRAQAEAQAQQQREAEVRLRAQQEAEAQRAEQQRQAQEAAAARERAQAQAAELRQQQEAAAERVRAQEEAAARQRAQEQQPSAFSSGGRR